MGVAAVDDAPTNSVGDVVRELTIGHFEECCRLADRAYDHCEKALLASGDATSLSELVDVTLSKTWDPPSFGCDPIEADDQAGLQQEVEDEFQRRFDELVMGWIAEGRKPDCCSVLLPEALQSLLSWLFACMPQLRNGSYESGIFEELEYEARHEEVINDDDLEVVAGEGFLAISYVPVAERPTHAAYFAKARCSDALNEVLVRNSRVQRAMWRRKKRLAAGRAG